MPSWEYCLTRILKKTPHIHELFYVTVVFYYYPLVKIFAAVK